MLHLFDRVTLDAEGPNKPRKTRDGYLVANPITARTGIQVYGGTEVDPENKHGMRDRAQVLIYRPESEVFSGDTMASMAHRPITNDHPSELVTADNWKKYATGFTTGEIARDGDAIRLPVMLADAAQIADVEAGKRQLSWGYTCSVDFTPGQTPDGVSYDGVQRNIRGNHLAVVDAARAGPEFRLFDSGTQQQKEPGMTLRMIMVDGISIQTTDQGAEAISKLNGLLKDTAGKLESQAGTIAAMTQTHTAAIQAKDAEIAALTAKVPDGAALDALVAGRTALVVTARKLLGDAFDPTGKGESEIRRAAVAVKLGDAFVIGKTEAFVDAAFATLAATVSAVDAQVDPIANAVRDARPAPAATAVVEKAYADSIEREMNAWKGAA